jgi:hypothetical protein
LAYGLVVAMLFATAVIFGIWTFYGEPRPPVQPPGPLKLPGEGAVLSCDVEGRCQKAARNGETRAITLEDEGQLTEGERLFIEEWRAFSQEYLDYWEAELDHDRNVLVLASAIGVTSLCAGLFLRRRAANLPPGLLLGGLGTAFLGWIQPGPDLDDIGVMTLGAVLVTGLAVLLAAGYFSTIAPRPHAPSVESGSRQGRGGAGAGPHAAVLAVAILGAVCVNLGIRILYDAPGPASFDYPYDQMYLDESADYSRNVLVISMVLGLGAVVAGLLLFRRVDVVALAVLSGGFGVILFGWHQAVVEREDIGPGLLFGLASAGLAVVLAAGYWFVGFHRRPRGAGPAASRSDRPG